MARAAWPAAYLATAGCACDSGQLARVACWQPTQFKTLLHNFDDHAFSRQPTPPSNFSPKQTIAAKMDPYSSEGELINIHTAFHQYQYEAVVSDFDPSSFSTENHLPARILQLRARVALGQADDVFSETKGEKQPELAVVNALALAGQGKTEQAVEAVEKLLSEGGDAVVENAIVQVVGGTVLAGAGKGEEALVLLGRHQGNRELAFP